MHLENSRAPFIIFNSSLDAYILGKMCHFTLDRVWDGYIMSLDLSHS